MIQFDLICRGSNLALLLVCFCLRQHYEDSSQAKPTRDRFRNETRTQTCSLSLSLLLLLLLPQKQSNNEAKQNLLLQSSLHFPPLVLIQFEFGFEPGKAKQAKLSVRIIVGLIVVVSCVAQYGNRPRSRSIQFSCQLEPNLTCFARQLWFEFP